MESSEGVRVALENGVDTIEHGAVLDDAAIQLFQETGACHVATLSPALPYALFDRSVSHVSEMEQYNGNVVFEGIISCAKTCLEYNIPVGLGTDTGCPFTTQYDMWREVNYFHKFCNVSNTFALYTATKRNAQLAGLGDQTGSIEPRQMRRYDRDQRQSAGKPGSLAPCNYGGGKRHHLCRSKGKKNGAGGSCAG